MKPLTLDIADFAGFTKQVEIASRAAQRGPVYYRKKLLATVEVDTGKVKYTVEDNQNIFEGPSLSEAIERFNQIQ